MDSLKRKKTLLEIRKEHHLKQCTVLELLHIDRKTLYNWEHCITAPDHWQLQALCKLYGVNKDALALAPRHDPLAWLPDDVTYSQWERNYTDVNRVITLPRRF